MEDVEAIVRDLTPGQREAIISARDLMSNHGGYPFFEVDATTGTPWPQGIAQFLTIRWDRLTPLGLAVRTYLLSHKE